MKYSREDKLKLAKGLKGHDSWPWFSHECAQEINFKKKKVNSTLENLETEIFRDGVVAGIEWCLSLPDRTEKDSEAFFNRVYTKVFGVEK